MPRERASPERSPEPRLAAQEPARRSEPPARWTKLATQADWAEQQADIAAQIAARQGIGTIERIAGAGTLRPRIHAGPAAAEVARSEGAEALTIGEDVFLGAGSPSPEAPAGRALLGHELMHVAQQRRTGVRVQRSPESDAISLRTSWGDLDEDRLGADLLAEAEAARYDFVGRVLEELSGTDRDDVSFGFMSHLPEDGTGSQRLGALAASAAGRALLDRLFDELTAGSVSEDEQHQADRIIAAKTQAIPQADFLAGVESAKIFPYRLPGFTVLDDAPLSAERRDEGRIWAHYPVRVLGTDMFRAETRTLPTETFLGGIELPENEIVGVKMYDLGGEVHFRPALYLVQLANETDTTVLTKAGEAAGYGLTLGAGPAVAGAGRLAQVLLWADRVALVLGTITSLIREHRGWIIERWGASGRRFLRYIDIVNSAVMIYGGLRAVVAMGQLVASLGSAYRNWRTAAQAAEGLSESEQAVVRQVSQGTEQLLDDAERIRTAQPPETATGAGAAGAVGEPPPVVQPPVGEPPVQAPVPPQTAEQAFADLQGELGTAPSTGPQPPRQPLVEPGDTRWGGQGPPQGAGTTGPVVQESAGASTRGPEFQSASAQTARSIRTAIIPDLGEVQAYREALLRGEVGLQRPLGANVPGADFITAARESGDWWVIVTDAKTRSVATSAFPSPATAPMPATWRAEAAAAVARLSLGNPQLEAEIQAALAAGRVRLRQINVDLSAAGQGATSGW